MKLCEECLDIIMNNLSKEDIMILEFLYKKKAINKHLSFEKIKIIREIQDLTDFKFQIAISRLEVTALVDKETKGRGNKYFITKNGQSVILKYMEETKASLLSIGKK